MEALISKSCVLKVGVGSLLDLLGTPNTKKTKPKEVQLKHKSPKNKTQSN